MKLDNVKLPKLIPGLYEHYSGKRYQVIAIARFSEDPHKEFVVYKQLDDATLMPDNITLPAGTCWVRPLEMFCEIVESKDGKRISRFRKID